MSNLVERVVTNVELPVRLTEEERQKRAELCTTQTSRLEKIKDEAKDAAAEYRERMKPLVKELRALSTAYMTGIEVQIVPQAVRVYDLEANMTWLSYNGEVYETREITKYELAGLEQRQLHEARQVALLEMGLPAEEMIHEETKTKPARKRKEKQEDEDDADEQDD